MMRNIIMTIACVFVTFSAAAQAPVLIPSVNKGNVQQNRNIAEEIKKLQQMKQESDAKLENEEPKDAIQAIMAMNKCMEKSMDQKMRSAMEKRSQEFSRQLRELCKAGKEDEAKEFSVEYAQQFSQSDEFKAMKACADKYKTMMKDPMFDGIRKRMETAEPAQKEVCGPKKS